MTIMMKMMTMVMLVMWWRWCSGYQKIVAGCWAILVGDAASQSRPGAKPSAALPGGTECTLCTVQLAVPHKNTHTQKMHNYTNTQMHKNTKASQSRAGANASVALLRGSAPQPCPISEPPNPIREPSSPLYLKPPSYAPPYITLYPCPAPPIWSPSDRGVELGAPPGDNNGSSVLKWRQITMLFNGSPETQNLQKQTMGGTLKAQSVHQRCRKVSATMGWGNFWSEDCFRQNFNKGLVRGKILGSSLQVKVVFKRRLQNAWSPL